MAGAARSASLPERRQAQFRRRRYGRCRRIYFCRRRSPGSPQGQPRTVDNAVDSLVDKTVNNLILAPGKKAERRVAFASTGRLTGGLVKSEKVQSARYSHTLCFEQRCSRESISHPEKLRSALFMTPSPQVKEGRLSKRPARLHRNLLHSVRWTRPCYPDEQHVCQFDVSLISSGACRCYLRRPSDASPRSRRR